MMPNPVTIAEQLFNDSDRARLQAFAARYPDPAYLWLACHAAFPVALTHDLLYKIWLNFRQDEDGITFDLSLNAVSELLFSPLCEGIGHNLYEIPLTLRTVLWQSLSRERIALLAEFLLQYLNFCRDKVPSDAFAEAQRIWANTIRSPDEVAKLLLQLTANRITNTRDRIMAEYVLNWVKSSETATNEGTETASSRSDNLNQAVSLLEGIRQYESGQITDAQATFSSISHLLHPPQAGGFNVPIPREIWQNLPVSAPAEEPKGKIYAVLVGIDAKENNQNYLELSGGSRDITLWKSLLEQTPSVNSLQVLINQSATKKAILQSLRDAVNKASEIDSVFFVFVGEGIYEKSIEALRAYDSIPEDESGYILEFEPKSILTESSSKNPFFIMVLDALTGGPHWIDSNNEKHILLTVIPNWGKIPKKTGMFNLALNQILGSTTTPISYHRLLKTIYQVEYANSNEYLYQTPQLFGHPKAINQAFLSGNTSQNTYINELLQNSDYKNIEKLLEDFAIESQEDKFIATLEKYALLKDAEKLKVVRVSSEMSVRQIPVFQREYLKNLPYEVEIKDISLFYTPSRAGLKDSMGYQEDIEDDLSALQDVHIIVFILNRALVNDFARHRSIAPVVNHLKRFEYKVVCSILWEDCDRGDTALRDYPVFLLRQPLSQALFQKYNFASEVEREIEDYYQDWQPVINKWITDLASLGFEKELKERIEKAKQTKELDLSGMGFEKLPEAVWELEDLKTIDLYNNKLTELPESLTQFQSLEKLYASKNPITSLPLFLSDLPNLRILKIDDAQITEFPNWLCKHPALEDISLENNQIEIIPSALQELPKLRLIDFRGNPVINLSASLLKATKGRLKEYLNGRSKNIIRSLSSQNDTVILYIDFNEKDKQNLIQSFIRKDDEKKNTVFTDERFREEMIVSYNVDLYTMTGMNIESIYHFSIPKQKSLIVHLPDNTLSDTEIQTFSKLFPEYPTGTIFFLNFSNSKRLAELLYQQKHFPIIAFEGELDEETAGDAVRYFYAEYQESKNAISAFQYMILKLPETPSNGLYILYRY